MKLLVFDVDGTLIGADLLWKKSTVDSLNSCLLKGDAIAIASGRPALMIKAFLDKLIPGKKFVIAANGAGVYDLNLHPLSIVGVTFEDYVHFYHDHQNVVDLGADIYCYTLDKVGYLKYGSFIDFETGLNDIGSIDLLAHPLNPNDPLLKFMIAWDHPDWSKVNLSDEEKKRYHIIRSDPRFLEFVNPEVDKATGVEALRLHLGLKKRDVYCFGDEGNDLKMVQDYQGVAMGNAIPEVKKAAKFVTLSVGEDGVSYAIKHFVKD